MPFISTALIDSFARPDAATLGPGWGPTPGGAVDLRIENNRCKGPAIGTATAGSMWQQKMPPGDMEAWVDVMALPTGAGSFRLYLALVSTIGEGLADNPWVGGYGLIYSASDNQLTITQFRANSLTSQAAVTWTFGTGVRLGFARVGGGTRAYIWTPAAGPTQVLQYNPGLTSGGLPYTGPGWIGLQATTQVGFAPAEFENFGGGQTPFEVRTKRRTSRMTNWS